MGKSWKQQFDDLYQEIASSGNSTYIDEANEVVLRAIEELREIGRGP